MTHFLAVSVGFTKARRMELVFFAGLFIVALTGFLAAAFFDAGFFAPVCLLGAFFAAAFFAVNFLLVEP